MSESTRPNPEICEVEGVLTQSLDAAAREAVLAELLGPEGPPTDRDQIMTIGAKYGIDSLDFVEARMALEDCGNCEHGLGVLSCRVGKAVALID